LRGKKLIDGKWVIIGIVLLLILDAIVYLAGLHEWGGSMVVIITTMIVGYMASNGIKNDIIEEAKKGAVNGIIVGTIGGIIIGIITLLFPLPSSDLLNSVIISLLIILMIILSIILYTITGAIGGAIGGIMRVFLDGSNLFSTKNYIKLNVKERPYLDELSTKIPGERGYLVCDKCQGYYRLQEGESPEDFSEYCECGGNLKYYKKLNYHLIKNF